MKGPQLNRVTITINGDAWTWNANTCMWVSPIPQAALTNKQMIKLVHKYAKDALND